MNRPKFKYFVWTGFVGGLVSGLIVGSLVLFVGGLSVVSTQEIESQRALLAELEEENQELTEDLFKARTQPDFGLNSTELPYDEQAEARQLITKGREEALGAKKFLMVTFGANWCMDCRTLHRILRSQDVQQYTSDLFVFVNVDVGKFNKNRDLATELGVSLTKGIPVAVFFDPAGEVIGTTNEGQLEPARRYSSRQILRFVRDIAERSEISAPDAVRTSRTSSGS